MKKRLFFALLFSYFLACQKDNSPTAAPDEHLSGGTNGSTNVQGENAFDNAMKNLTQDEQNAFVTGNSLFRINWLTAPASVQSLDGLGPVFNAISCGSCHFKDGRAKPPTTPDEGLNGLLFRLSNCPDYGEQLQDKAIMKVDYEARVRVSYQDIVSTYPEGTAYTLKKPIYEFHDFKYGIFPSNFLFSPRIAQQVIGLGLLENVSEQDILAIADENDQNGDGISGRANRVLDEAMQQTVLGRFGWKANQPSLRQQTAGAFNGDIGITSSLFPKDHLTPVQQQRYPNIPNGGNPELSDDQLRKVTTYMQTLAVPVRRSVGDKEVLQGRDLFQKINCSACHRTELTTSNSSPIAALNGQKIHPYTDLLLHDMGNDLADGRPDFLATGTEWRTPPLWGIGLLKVVNGHTNLLHDGRARNIEEAILWHGGEAEKAKNDFKKLSIAERKAVLRFLESL